MRRIDNWDLGLRRQVEHLSDIPVVCDAGQISTIVTLTHSALKRGKAAAIQVIQYISEAPWLEAALRMPPGEPRADGSLGPEGKLEMVIRCIRAPDGDECAAADSGLNISIGFNLEEDGRQQLRHDLKLTNLRLQTRQQAEIAVEFNKLEVPTLSKRSQLGSGNIALCSVAFTQLPGHLKYIGQLALVGVTAFANAVSKGMRRPVDTLVQVGAINWPAIKFLPNEIGDGSAIVHTLCVSASDLFAAAEGKPEISLDLECISICEFPGGDRREQKKSFGFRIDLSQDEVLALRHGEMVAVPKMPSNAIGELLDFESELSIPETPPQVEKLDFEIQGFDSALSGFEVYATMKPDLEISGYESTWRRIASGQNLKGAASVSVPVGALFSEAAIDRPENVRLVLVAHMPDDTKAAGAVRIGLAVREQPATYMACVDFGASAISAWFGIITGTPDNKLLPLGDFAQSIVGMHGEYDPHSRGGNDLMPSAASLDSSNHVRSKRDPLSLGSLSMAGDATASVLTRLEKLDRTYDISMPVIQEGPHRAMASIPDLKRRVLHKRDRLSASVFERNGGKLRKTTKIDLSKATRNAFQELGSYVTPRALFLSQSLQNGKSGEGTGYLAWTMSTPKDIKVVVTHPSGITAGQREIYVEAARAYAVEFAGPGTREPGLVPEALAAAYYGITRQKHKVASAKGGQANLYACIDIGASTVDASLVRAELESSGMISGWKVMAHFGATVGGANLDEALLELVVKHLRRLFPSPDTRLGDLGMDSKFTDEAILRAELPAKIELAKRTLTTAIMARQSVQDSYAWPTQGHGGRFQISLNGILVSAVPGARIRVARHETDPLGGVVLRVENSGEERSTLGRDEKGRLGGQDIWLEISPQLLDGADEIEEVDSSDPKAVARLLGTAIPAMLSREAARLEIGPVTNWIVTGRGSLWPSIYGGISGIVARMSGNGVLSPWPYPASEMKNAIVLGARALAMLEDDLTDAAKHPYGLVSYNGEGSIHDIFYLPMDGGPNGIKRPYQRNCWLSRVLPGLSDPGSAHTIARDEIVRLFAAFKQQVAINECLVKPAGVYAKSDHKEVGINWESRGDRTVIKVGDITVLPDHSRLAGAHA